MSLNDDDMPCFATAGALGDITRSCITKCDILARNGVVHEIDTVLLYEVGETLGPTPPTPPAFNDASAPIWTVREAPTYSNPTNIYQNPTGGGRLGDSSGERTRAIGLASLVLTVLAAALL